MINDRGFSCLARSQSGLIPEREFLRSGQPRTASLAGNNDAHGKNFFLLYHGVGNVNQEIRLAPLYDLVSTMYCPELSKHMAMKIGREYKSERVTLGAIDPAQDCRWLVEDGKPKKDDRSTRIASERRLGRLLQQRAPESCITDSHFQLHPVTPGDFEELAEEACLARPIARRRISELADAVLVTIRNVATANPAAEARCPDTPTV